MAMPSNHRAVALNHNCAVWLSLRPFGLAVIAKNNHVLFVLISTDSRNVDGEATLIVYVIVQGIAKRRGALASIRLLLKTA